MALPIVIVSSGGWPITEASNGLGAPVVVAANGFGIAATIVASGGVPVVGLDRHGVRTGSNRRAGHAK